VKKKSGKYRLINSAININRVIIKDINLPSISDKFTEEFARRVINSYFNFFSDYDQLKLNEKSKDLIAIIIDLGLLR
jgi:hypothetical protein